MLKILRRLRRKHRVAPPWWPRGYKEGMRFAAPDSPALRPIDFRLLDELVSLGDAASSEEDASQWAYLIRALAEIRLLRRRIEALEGGRRLCLWCGGSGEREVAPSSQLADEGWSHLECSACHGTGFASVEPQS
ncbi:MAG: hypothetical protein AB1760_10200 [Pseudomonadota bacterium]